MHHLQTIRKAQPDYFDLIFQDNGLYFVNFRHYFYIFVRELVMNFRS